MSRLQSIIKLVKINENTDAGDGDSTYPCHRLRSNLISSENGADCLLTENACNDCPLDDYGVWNQLIIDMTEEVCRD